MNSLPSMWDLNIAPISLSILVNFDKDIIWNPPESVKIGSLQFINWCNPPNEKILSTPGLNNKWYVFDKIIWVPDAIKFSRNTALTVPWVPTGMKEGVSTKPCGVTIWPHLAYLCSLITLKENFFNVMINWKITAHFLN